jgi:hypothetical protein
MAGALEADHSFGAVLRSAKKNRSPRSPHRPARFLSSRP